MLFQTGNRGFEVVQTVLVGAANDVYICCEIGVNPKTYYTLIKAKDRKVTKKMVELFHHDDQGVCILTFGHEENLCFLLNYRTPRPIERFFMGGVRTQNEIEELILKVVLECLGQSKSIPYPLLALILKHQNVNLTQDNNIYFTFALDFSEIDINCTEQQCVMELATLLVRLLQQQQKFQGVSFELIERKFQRGIYNSFSELYQDIRITTAPAKKLSIVKRIRLFFNQRRDLMFRILLVGCIAMFIIALVSLGSNMLFGKSIFGRLFSSSFEIIGTENMML